MERSELTSRVIPTMALSEGSSPLTAPLPPLCTTTGATNSSPSSRAIARFAITGNAVVTGGAGDLGFTACRALLDHGLSGLVIFDLDPVLDPVSATARVEQLRVEYPSTPDLPRQISFARVNVTDEADVTANMDKVADDLGSVDILLAFAGVASCAHSLEVPAQEWRRVLDINTTGSFLCAQAVARVAALRTRRPASIVVISSISGHTVNYPQPQAAYNASKAAVRVMARSLAAEWARYGVRVNSVSPGYMDTILNEGEGLKVARDTWTERNPMGRMGVPEELCGAVVLLASGAGRYITGADLVVDGGQTLF